MNCQTAQNRLLASERPDQPGGEVAHHLARCRACRAWQVRLVRLERALPQLNVPPSRGPGDVVRQILQVETPARVLPLSPTAPTSREGGRRKLALALAMAASLAALALGLWAWPSSRPVPIMDVAVAPHARQRDDILTTPRAPSARVKELVDLAEKVLDEASDPTIDPDQLEKLARFYSKLVRRDVLEHARHVAQADRARVLDPLAAQLRRNESEASRLAARHVGLGADSLRTIAIAAREGDYQLRALVQGRWS